MNNSDLSLEFLKKCQKYRESGVNGDMAILAALHDLADYKDQHPRKGLWNSEKVCNIIDEVINSDTIVQYLIFDDENIDFDSELFFEDLCKAMKD